MIYNNISFDGYHCRDDMCLIYVPADAKPIIAPQSVYSYTIGGMSGTTAYGDRQTAREYTCSGVFYPAHDLRNEQEAMELWRRIAQWLGAGRRKLIYDSEPDKYVIAEVQSMTNDEYGWIDGGLQVTWLCQPYHWAVRPEEVEMNISGKVSQIAGYRVFLAIDTDLPAPVDATVINDGTTTITDVVIKVGANRVAFNGMNLLPGEQLHVCMKAPIGAVFVAADGTTCSAMGCMTTFQQLLSTGAEAASCDVTFASVNNGNSALCRLVAQGCWR